MAKEHYHVNTFSGDGTGVGHNVYVYRARRDAEDALEDARRRSRRPDTPFAPEEADAEQVKVCTDPLCIGEDG